MNMLLIALLVILGALVFYGLLPLATGPQMMRDLQDLRGWFARKWKIATRYGTELGGYVHDTAMSQFISPADCHYVTGTWSDAAGAVAGSIAKTKAAADQVGVVTIPICPPQNSVELKGSYLKSIDIWWNCTVAAMDAVSALIHQIVLPANGVAFPAVVVQAFSYDTGHDTAAERLTLDEHKMTLTLTTPFWLDNDDEILVQLSADAAATSVFAFHGARANYTARL